MLVVLELQDQAANIRRVTVRHDIVVGRGSDCNLRLSAPQISRRHCFLRIGRESASIMDLDSRNGTFLDNVRVESGRSYSLTHGSMLALGPIRFRVEIRSETGTESDLPLLDDSISGLGGSPNRAASTNPAELKPNGPIGGTGDAALRFLIEHRGHSAEPQESTAGMDADAVFFPGSADFPSQSEHGGGGAARENSQLRSDSPEARGGAGRGSGAMADPAAEFASAAERLAGGNPPGESGGDWFSGISPSPLQQVDDDLRQFFRSLS